jgi:hypothetical protein
MRPFSLFESCTNEGCRVLFSTRPFKTENMNQMNTTNMSHLMNSDMEAGNSLADERYMIRSNRKLGDCGYRAVW